MYLLVMKYDKDGTLISADLGEKGKNWEILYLDGKIHEADYPVIPKDIEKGLEELIKKHKGPYEIRNKFYGKDIKVVFYRMDKLENPIKEGQEREVAEELIKYYKEKK